MRFLAEIEGMGEREYLQSYSGSMVALEARVWGSAIPQHIRGTGEDIMNYSFCFLFRRGSSKGFVDCGETFVGKRGYETLYL